VFKNKNVFCFILARGGSKGVLRKNTRIIAGKPLIVHSIDVAKKTRYIDEVFVSTDDSEIKAIAKDNGATVIDRPTKLATDTSSYIDAVKHLINSVEKILLHNPVIVLLTTTSPIKEVSDVEKCIEILDENIDCVATVSNVNIFPDFMYREKNGLLHPYLVQPNFKNRQEMEKLVYYNGSILVTTSNFIKKQEKTVFGGKMKGYLLDEKHSVDIDTEFEFKLCKLLIESN